MKSSMVSMMMNGQDMAREAMDFAASNVAAVSGRLSGRSVYIAGSGVDFDLFTAPLLGSALDVMGVACLNLQQTSPLEGEGTVARFTIPFEYIEPANANGFTLLICQCVISMERETTALMRRVLRQIDRAPESIWLLSWAISDRARNELIERHVELSDDSFLTPPPIDDLAAKALRARLHEQLDQRKRPSVPMIPKWVRTKLRGGDHDIVRQPDRGL